MNIVVCVKYVPDAQADRTFEDADHTTDRVGVDGRLSELDEYAVEEALKIVEAGGGEGDQVTVLTVGPEQAAEAIKKSLQMGAHAGVHVSDDAIAGSDAAATSLVLAKAIEKLGAETKVDLVLTGMASTDGTMSVVPAMLAERLGLPQVTYASEVTVSGRRRRSPSAATATPSTQTIDVEPARRGQRHRPDQRAALPLVQGDHGRQEEAGAGLGDRPTSASTRARSAWPPPGRRSRPSRPARRARRARSSPTRATAAPSSPSSSSPASSSDRPDLTPRRSLMSEVLVLVDHVDGAVRKTTTELLTIARQFGEPSAVFVGSGFDAAKATLAEFGAAKVYRIESADVSDHLVAPTAEALAQLVERTSPAAVLIASQRRGQGDRGPAGDQDRLRPDHRRRRRRPPT